MRWLARSSWAWVALVVAVYFAVVAIFGSGPSAERSEDTGSPTTLASTTSTTVAAVGSAPGEGAWEALPSQREVEVEVYAAALAAIPTTTVPEPQPPVRTPPAPVPTPPPASGGGTIEAFLACTRAHESDTAGGYQAVSPSGAHRGAYQFVQSTWDTVARWVGQIGRAHV